MMYKHYLLRDNTFRLFELAPELLKSGVDMLITVAILSHPSPHWKENPCVEIRIKIPDLENSLRTVQIKVGDTGFQTRVQHYPNLLVIYCLTTPPLVLSENVLVKDIMCLQTIFLVRAKRRRLLEVCHN